MKVDLLEQGDEVVPSLAIFDSYENLVTANVIKHQENRKYNT